MDRGGAEMRTLEVMRRLPDGVTFDFVTLSGRAGTLAPDIEKLGGRVMPVAIDSSFPVRFAAILREQKTRIIHSHVHLTSGLILTIARLAGVSRRIAHFRTTTDDRGSGPLRRSYRLAMRRLVDSAATDILAVSEGVMEAGWSREWQRDPRCQVIYNGVDASAFDLPRATGQIHAQLGIPAGSPVVVQVGRFDKVKNQAWSIQVLEALPRSDVHLVLVGRGGTPEESDVRRMVVARELRHRVHFVGERLDVPVWLAAADASILPSFHEGLPGAVLESIAAGTPVLASDLPGVREIASRLPGVSARGLDDSARHWAADLERMLAARPTPISRASWRDALQRSVFSLDSSADTLIDLWTQ
jgi:glycosyltransferase involved in cell wall biosynthesis